MRIRPAHLALPLVLVGTLAACGDDDDDVTSSEAPAASTAAPGGTTMDSSTATMSTTPGSSSATTMESMDSMGTPAEATDIVDTAIAAGDFTTLVSAVQAAGLEETLRGPGPFTVFAPTDDAFTALPAGTLDTLLADPTGDLADILSYHVVDGAVMAADVAGLDGQDVTTVNGATFTVEVGDDGGVSLTDATGNTVTVVQTDIAASNGVIHVIDGVLLPG